MGSSKKLNKPRLYLGLVIIIILAAIILSLVSHWRGNPIKAKVKEALGQDVAAQSYAVAKSPSLKPDDRFFGSQSAPLRVFVFEDYTSLYSASLADTLDRINAESGDKVALVVRPFSNNSLESAEAARAVICAGQAGKWKEMRALLFMKAKNRQAVADDWLSYAGQLKLDENNFLACLTNQKKSGTIEQLLEEAKTYGVQGSPTMFIGDEMVVGARPYDNFVDSNGDKIEGLKSLLDRKLNKV